ncbi:MAG TPA: DNA repair protein RecN [Deinococcales bacterium]|nr:DNA repair protein RecN [Deinococcales bacterium]
MDRLEVSNLAIIDRLDLRLDGGLSVFTGETGAGKSIIVDAISLLLGSRGGTDLVRNGEDSLLVTAWLDGRSLSRRVTTTGRSTARLDGEVVTVRELAEVAGEALTVHGQHAAQVLLNPERHRDYLDATIDPDGQAARAECERAYRALTQAQAQLDELNRSERERARRLDLILYQLNEIRSASLKPEEEEALLGERERLANAVSIGEGAATALDALSDGDHPAETAIGAAIKALASAGRHDADAAQLAADLREALGAVQAVTGEARGLLERSAPDPQELDRVEERLSLISRLKQKYGATVEEVLQFEREMGAEAETLERAESDIATLAARIAPLTEDLRGAAARLSASRETAAALLAPRLEEVVRDLGMPKARLAFDLRPLPSPGPRGQEDVEIVFSANPGEDLASLAKIASGGELSRVMLALSTVLGAETPTVVFDEVDAGIGGQAAVSVGDRLARLARGRQVLVVTHLAQIAARAGTHYRVSKHEQGGRTQVRVERLTGEARVQELARMLSGSITPAALDHARELLTSAAAA